MPIAQTTPCLTLGLLNDEGLMAYGNHRKELAYATRKIGIQWSDLSNS